MNTSEFTFILTWYLFVFIPCGLISTLFFQAYRRTKQPVYILMMLEINIVISLQYVIIFVYSKVQ